MSNIGDTENPNKSASPRPLPWFPSRGLIIAALLGVAGVLVASWLIYSPPQFIAGKTEDQGAYTPQTEAVFASQQTDLNADVMAEWRDVRGDHKILAYAIGYCKSMRSIIGNIDTMPRNVFSALLLDLTPNGEHKFILPILQKALSATQNPVAKDATDTSTPGLQEIQGSPVAITTKAVFDLSNHQQSMLSLSDAIGRARLSAASEASGNYPKMTTFGWVTIGISAIATLLVTIKASMTPPAPEARRMTYVFIGVGLLAMTLSALGTALTSAKQFYDPTRAYRMSKAALSELQRLHKQVVLEFAGNLNLENCAPIETTEFTKSKRIWASKLADLQAGVLMASSNLQGSDIAQLRAEIAIRPSSDEGATSGQTSRPPVDVNAPARQ